MCRIAISGNPAFAVSDLELRRSGPSYTIDTVQELLQAGHSRIHWLIGADMLMTLPHWHRARELIGLATFIIMARPGTDLDFSTLPPDFRHLERNRIDAPLLDISATDIRNRIRANLPIDHLTPPAVARYIAEKNLYRS